jgi:hypothetical protein
MNDHSDDVDPTLALADQGEIHLVTISREALLFLPSASTSRFWRQTFVVVTVTGLAEVNSGTISVDINCKRLVVKTGERVTDPRSSRQIHSPTLERHLGTQYHATALRQLR